jgi:cytochrome c oxidase subunit II
MRTTRRTVLVAGIASLASLMVGGAAVGQKARVIPVKVRRFAFTPSRIELTKGEPVIFELTTEDIFMGMNIPDFGVRSDIVPGKTMTLALTPDKAGTFTFLCDVFCGDGHESMSGTLVVT